MGCGSSKGAAVRSSPEAKPAAPKHTSVQQTQSPSNKIEVPPPNESQTKLQLPATDTEKALDRADLATPKETKEQPAEPQPEAPVQAPKETLTQSDHSPTTLKVSESAELQVVQPASSPTPEVTQSAPDSAPPTDISVRSPGSPSPSRPSRLPPLNRSIKLEPKEKSPDEIERLEKKKRVRSANVAKKRAELAADRVSHLKRANDPRLSFKKVVLMAAVLKQLTPVESSSRGSLSQAPQELSGPGSEGNEVASDLFPFSLEEPEEDDSNVVVPSVEAYLKALQNREVSA